MASRQAGGLAPLLLLVIEALEAQNNRDRQREAYALRAFGELARVEIPGRGVFAPTDSELYEVIESIAARHLGFAPAAKALRRQLGAVEPFATRDAVASAANHVRTISDLAYFDAGLAFGITFAELRSLG
jgi:hypothetical protein